MNWKHYLGITLISGVILAFAASFQAAPGYMDAEYYYSMGLRIASGQGLSEPFLWNYLSEVEAIPHPGFSYWMPMPAFLSAAGIWITGLKSFLGAKFVHVVLAALIPALTMKVTKELTENSAAAILAGLLAVFPVFYGIFLITTDSFAITILLGGLFFLLTRQKSRSISFLGLGFIAGLMHLSRADGLIWLIAGLYCALKASKQREIALAAVFGGYLVGMTPWFIRNLLVLGQILPSGLASAFWLREYNDLFIYSPAGLTYQNWISRGARAILGSYLDAGVANLRTAILIQGQIILAPFILLGSWEHRRDVGLRAAFLVWVCLLLLMSFVFPFAGERGGFFHSSAAFQTMIWGLAACGFIKVIAWGVDKRSWVRSKAGVVFGSVLVVMVAVAAVFTFSTRVIGENGEGPVWNDTSLKAKDIDTFLNELGLEEDELVLINNPPGLYSATGRSSIVIPAGGLEDLLSAGNKFGAYYLLLEENHPPELNDLYENPEKVDRLLYLGQVNDALVFQFTDNK